MGDNCRLCFGLSMSAVTGLVRTSEALRGSIGPNGFRVYRLQASPWRVALPVQLGFGFKPHQELQKSAGKESHWRKDSFNTRMANDWAASPAKKSAIEGVFGTREKFPASAFRD
jgi:hypothetical protein